MAETVTPAGRARRGPAARRAPLEAAGARRARPAWSRSSRPRSDPGNAGTVIRTADAAGADAVVLTDGSTDPHSGKCVRATAGSLWHLPVVHGPTLADDGRRACARAGLHRARHDGSGRGRPRRPARRRRAAGPTAWLFGNEAARAVRRRRSPLADRTVRIPLHGRAESLNLATAAAVCLYASARAQRGCYRTRRSAPSQRGSRPP